MSGKHEDISNAPRTFADSVIVPGELALIRHRRAEAAEQRRTRERYERESAAFRDWLARSSTADPGSPA